MMNVECKFFEISYDKFLKYINDEEGRDERGAIRSRIDAINEEFRELYNERLKIEDKCVPSEYLRGKNLERKMSELEKEFSFIDLNVQRLKEDRLRGIELDISDNSPHPLHREITASQKPQWYKDIIMKEVKKQCNTSLDFYDRWMKMERRDKRYLENDKWGKYISGTVMGIEEIDKKLSEVNKRISDVNDFCKKNWPLGKALRISERVDESLFWELIVVICLGLLLFYFVCQFILSFF